MTLDDPRPLDHETPTTWETGVGLPPLPGQRGAPPPAWGPQTRGRTGGPGVPRDGRLGPVFPVPSSVHREDEGRGPVPLLPPTPLRRLLPHTSLGRTPGALFARTKEGRRVEVGKGGREG